MAIGTLGVVIAYMLLLQSVFAGLSQSMMLGALSQPQPVICSIHGPSATPGAPFTAPDHAAKCPCATLCQLGASFSPALAHLDPLPLVAPATPLRLALAPAQAPRVQDSAERFSTEARAPPSSFA